MNRDPARTTKARKHPAAKRQPCVARERKAAYKTAVRPSLTRAEARAIGEFRARLKAILPNGELKSLILYGSKARGDPHRGSDIDLLVVYDSKHGDKKDAIRDAVDNIELEALERDGKILLDIEPFVLAEAEFRQDAALGMPLLQNVAREGIVLEGEPIAPEAMDRKHWTSIHINDAKRQLESARLLLSHGDIRSAIAMAYFIYLDAARAALIAKGIAPQAHSGTNRLFGLHFVKPGLLPRKFGPHFGRLEKDRLEATYAKQKQFTHKDAERALAIAEDLVIAVENLLPKLLEEK